MPQPYDRGLVLDSLKRRMPELANYSDEDILKVYNRRQGLTPTGIPTLERKEQEAPPKYIHIRTPQHTGYGERFFKRFAEGLIPRNSENSKFCPFITQITPFVTFSP